MPERTGQSLTGECLDPEVLSAYIDNTLDSYARAQVEAHLASCAECYDLLCEVVRIQEAVPAARPSRDAARDGTAAPARQPAGALVARGAFGRRKLVWGATGALAAAAALVLMVRGLPTSEVDPRLADLVEAVGVERTVEARLTGGFEYRPLRSPVRSGGRAGPTDNLLLLAAAGRIREIADEDPTPDNLHASGVARLVIGEADAAIQDLERAMSMDGMRPAIANSLAAAYLSRYSSLGDPGDLRRALEFVERALAAEPEMPEALFNRALVLEGMDDDAAADAWEAYLRVDPQTQWAGEAKEHLTALRTPQRDS